MRILVADGVECIGSTVICQVIQNEKYSVRSVDELTYTDTHESLLEAAQFVETIEKRQGYKIACLEEIAYYQGWLNKEVIEQLAKSLRKNTYGQYLLEIIKEPS